MEQGGIATTLVGVHRQAFAPKRTLDRSHIGIERDTEKLIQFDPWHSESGHIPRRHARTMSAKVEFALLTAPVRTPRRANVRGLFSRDDIQLRIPEPILCRLRDPLGDPRLRHSRGAGHSRVNVHRLLTRLTIHKNMNALHVIPTRVPWQRHQRRWRWWQRRRRRHILFIRHRQRRHHRLGHAGHKWSRCERHGQCHVHRTHCKSGGRPRDIRTRHHRQAVRMPVTDAVNNLQARQLKDA